MRLLLSEKDIKNTNNDLLYTQSSLPHNSGSANLICVWRIPSYISKIYQLPFMQNLGKFLVEDLVIPLPPLAVKYVKIKENSEKNQGSLKGQKR